MKKVAIIGGGYTGLTTAYRLAKEGVSVTLYEKGPEVGGLVVGCTLDGIPLEKAYHFLYTTDSVILSLAEELGVRDNLTFHDSSVATFYDGKLYPFMTPGDLVKFTPISFLSRVRTGLAALYLARVTNWKPLTRVTAYDWLRKWTGKEATKVIWEPLLKGKFDSYYDKVAMSWLWSRIRVRANSKEKGSATEQLGYFKGGFRVLSDRLVTEIQAHGGTIVTSATLSNIEKQADGRVRVVGEGVDEVFDAVAATTPSHVFANLIKGNDAITPEYLKTLTDIDYLGAAVMVFSSTQEITDYYWHNVNDPNIPFLVFLSKSALAGSGNFGGKHIYYIGAYVPHEHRYFTMREDEIKNEWMDGLRKMFPEFNAQSISESHLYRFKDAQHIVGVDYQEKIPAYESPLSRVYLANFSQIFPDDRGTNYAVEEGNKLATMITESLKK